MPPDASATLKQLAKNEKLKLLSDKLSLRGPKLSIVSVIKLTAADKKETEDGRLR